MGAAYTFTSRWTVPAPPDRCWSAMIRMLRPGAPSWWPGVRVFAAPDALETGAVVVLGVRSPLGYRLRVRLVVDDVEEGRTVAASSTGDLRGTGRIAFTSVGEGAASVVVDWDVETERPWMNATAPVLRPLFALAHGFVMRAGERGLRAAVRRGG